MRTYQDIEKLWSDHKRNHPETRVTLTSEERVTELKAQAGLDVLDEVYVALEMAIKFELENNEKKP